MITLTLKDPSHTSLPLVSVVGVGDVRVSLKTTIVVKTIIRRFQPTRPQPDPEKLLNTKCYPTLGIFLLQKYNTREKALMYYYVTLTANTKYLNVWCRLTRATGVLNGLD